ncbi:hypothetical protein FE784_15225 [Paenibacillus hemerocallicola]|uniref:Nucleotidyltransferase domain-containing protein n=1 Tax=Paenibacillus hemerocallicola TaxID=1172614 RepID=A0A5C4T8E9_9BACL|nr:hypothetical protein [Paenibacillus hemerocallicola]TNJ65373.1 hypothetical protein FE784_15225 [Paenibacillus hemerocallicola]
MNERSYLADWRAVLDRRVVEVVDCYSKVEGVRALILGGSLGGGKPWPLSDIDIIPIYEDCDQSTANETIQELRVRLIEGWEKEGRRTALDVGTLYFPAGLASKIVQAEPASFETLLDQPSVYYCLDKAYGGRALFDPLGIGRDLVNWFNRHRFEDGMVALRMNKLKRRFAETETVLSQSIADGRHLEATFHLYEAVEHLRTYLLESWRERDNSFARLGTRFDKLAAAKNVQHVADRFNHLKSLDDRSVIGRMECATDWIRERHRLSHRSRTMVGEEVTEVQDARDVLRVFARYEMRSLIRERVGVCPDWLGVVTQTEELRLRHRQLTELCREVLERSD